MNYNNTLIKITKYILKYGIPTYIKKFIKINKINIDKLEFNYDINDIQNFLLIINKLVESYHKHSFVRLKYTNIINKNNYNFKNTPTKFYYTNKIGIIKLYSFDKYSLSHDEIKQYIKQITDFLDEHEFNGLILDFRKHCGGDTFSLVTAFSRFLNNTTLFGWSKNKISLKQKGWCNMINGKIEYNKYFLKKDINTNYPIAIIIGKQTKSAGEFVGSCFINSKNVKFFGEDSGGYLSVNDTVKVDKFEFSFPVLLQTSKNSIFKEYIEPDIYTNKPITEAKKWINKKNILI